MNTHQQADQNLAALRANSYPGRGIVIGQTGDGARFVQVYWIMGRSANSRNRVFVQDGNVVRTAPYDESRVEDPSLIIYNCTRILDRAHIVTNGDHTDTIHDGLAGGESFESSLHARTYEPDAPNYTPRIAGMVDLAAPVHAYQFAVLKTIDNDPSLPVRHFYAFERGMPGIGHMVTTYDGDGDPLPSFSGDPQPVPVPDSVDAALELYWSAMNADNKVSLLVKFIDPVSGACETRITNKHD